MNIKNYYNKIVESETVESVEKLISKIFRINNLIVPLSIIKSHFNDFSVYILNCIKNHEINNIHDFIFYVVDELEIVISNDESMRNALFDNKYYEISNNFEFVEVI